MSKTKTALIPDKELSVIHIGLVGGGKLCKEMLEKTSFDYTQEEAYAFILAVADPDPETPGMVLARERGLLTFADYHQLYDPRYNIHLIITLTPENHILEDILKTRPIHIRVMAYHVFEVFWKAIDFKARKLKARNEEVETILNGIQDFITVITPDLDIIEANESFLSKMGYSRQDVIGRKCYQIFQQITQPCDTEELPCPLNEAIRNKQHCRQVRTRIGSNEERRHIEVNVYPVWEKGGKISKFIHISRDITEHKKQEEEITRRLEQMVAERTRQLQETHDKLLHQDKMASLGKLAASVVHEINNPIAGIWNLTKLMERIIAEEALDLKELDQFSRYLNLMETETLRISRIVSNLLSFSRESKMAFGKLNLNRLIEKTLFLNSNLLKISGVKVEMNLDPNLPEIVGSEDQLQQVFMNIMSNAAEAIEPVGSGVLNIETQHLASADKIAVSFHNTGSFIPPENSSRIFEPFFTTKKKGKGAGLGLSVAYGIIDEHNGTIFVESTKDKGVTFTVRLPLSSHQTG
ncbi:MAG: ATP-binding protein [Pseudomonadota bacterium]